MTVLANPGDVDKVRIAHVSHRYIVPGGSREVLRDVSIRAIQNQTTGIIGPTGCGKSTLLRLIAGFETPTSGSVELLGSRGYEPAVPAPSIGYLFQRPALFPWLTIAENVAFGAERSNTYASKAELAQQMDYYLGRVGLQDARSLYPYQVSGGMQARAALARVFLTHPEVILMDEPFGALDALTRMNMWTLTKELLNSLPELTIVLISHDVDEVIMLCDRMIVLTGAPGSISAGFESDLGRKHESIESLQEDPEYPSLKASLLKCLHSKPTTEKTSNSNDP